MCAFDILANHKCDDLLTDHLLIYSLVSAPMQDSSLRETGAYLIIIPVEIFVAY
jgi:hypothetical protein